MINLLGRSGFRELVGEKYDFCHICGPQVYRVVVHFDGSSKTPTVGETITGVTTADTGVVESVTMTSTTAGVIELTSPSGYDSESSVMFQDNEALTGTTSGPSFSLVDGGCGVNKSGRMYPDSMLITYNGIKYCLQHFYWKFKREWEDETRVDTREPLRGI